MTHHDHEDELIDAIKMLLLARLAVGGIVVVAIAWIFLSK
jgi:hypothetical protein